MNPFGNGSQGALNVTSGITYLPLNTKLQYTTVNVGASGTIRPTGTTGSVLYILATESITINGTINTSGIVNYGNNTWGVTIDGDIYNSPGVANGGNTVIFSGWSNGQQSNGFGGGGGGAGDSANPGGNGGNGAPSGSGGSSASVTSNNGYRYSARNNGGGSSGGAGRSMALFQRVSGNITGTTSSGSSGRGGNAFGENGSAGGVGAVDVTGGSGNYNYYWLSNGGGGAGGRAGRAGVHLVLKSPTVIINGTINTSGTSGTNAGNGGRTRATPGFQDNWGYGGGGGGGGNAGNLNITYNYLENNGTLNMVGGSAGTGGIGGIGNAEQSDNGVSGSNGQVNLTVNLPTANFGSNVTSGPRPLTVNFTNLSQGADTYLWDFGDGTTSTLTSPTKVYSSVGSYTVSLKATNIVGEDTETKSNYITTTINQLSRDAGGTLLLGGSSTRTVDFSRTAGGSLLFSGVTRALVISDAEAIQDKIYLYKVYDPEGNYIETWKDVNSELNFTNEINSIGSTTTVELSRNSDSVSYVTNPLLTESGQQLLTEDDQQILVSTETRNQIGSGSSVDYNNRVDITAFYGSVEALYTESMEEILTENDEVILADLGAPNGRRIFTGFISEINSRYGSSETTLVQLTSYGYDLDQFVITTSPSSDITTVPFNSFDPSDIARQSVDSFASKAGLEQVSYTDRTDTSIAATGTVVSYTFRNNTYKDVLDKTLELMPSNWYYRVGLGDNIVYFQERSATPNHVFFLGKHIEALDLRGSILDVVNHTLFTGGGDPALYVERKNMPASRTRRGLEVMSDSRVTLLQSAQIISDGKIEEQNKLQYRTSISVLTKQYDIESINVGETIGFRNFGNYVDNLIMQVVGLNYTADVVQLQLETKPPTINKRLADVVRNLQVTDNSNIPTTPV